MAPCNKYGVPVRFALTVLEFVCWIIPTEPFDSPERERDFRNYVERASIEMKEDIAIWHHQRLPEITAYCVEPEIKKLRDWYRSLVPG